MQSQKNLLKISLVTVLLLLAVSRRSGAEARSSQRVEFSGWGASGSHPVILAGDRREQTFSPADASEDFVVVTISAGQWEDYVRTDSQSSTHESVDTVVQGSLIYNCVQGTVSGSVTAGLEHSRRIEVKIGEMWGIDDYRSWLTSHVGPVNAVGDCSALNVAWILNEVLFEWESLDVYEDSTGVHNENRGGGIVSALELAGYAGDPIQNPDGTWKPYTYEDSSFHCDAIGCRRTRQNVTVDAYGGTCDPEGELGQCPPVSCEPQLEIIAEPNPVEPGEDSTVTVSAWDCNGPLAARVTIHARVKARSGGHNHDDTSRPQGMLNGVSLSIKNQMDSIEVDTDPQGHAKVKYTTPISPWWREGKKECDKNNEASNHKCGIAGVTNVWAEIDGSDIKSHSVPVLVLVRGLHPVPTTTQHLEVTRGMTPTHPLGNFATLTTTRNLNEMARCHYGQYGEKLSVNDISLPWGGLFDYKGGFVAGKSWSPPHQTHGTGIGVDFNKEDDQFVKIVLTGKDFGRWDVYDLKHQNLHLNFDQQKVYTSCPGLEESSQPDLHVVKLLTGRPCPGATVIYAIWYGNALSHTTASNVVLTDTLPPGSTLISADPAYDRNPVAGQYVWHLGTLPPDSLENIVLTVRLSDSLHPNEDSITNAVTIASGSADADPLDNTFFRVAKVKDRRANATVQSHMGTTTLAPGHPVIHKLSYVNLGYQLASDVVLTASLPISCTLDASDPPPTTRVGRNQFVWNVGTLAPEAQGTMTLTTSVNVLRQTGPLISDTVPIEPGDLLPFTFEIGSSSDESDLSDNAFAITKTVEAFGSDLTVWLQRAGDTPAVGSTFTYTLTYGNFGNQHAPDSFLTGMWMTGTQMMAASKPCTATSIPGWGGGCTWDLGPLGIGDTGSMTLALRIDDAPLAGLLFQGVISTTVIEGSYLDNFVLDRYTRLGAPSSLLQGKVSLQGRGSPPDSRWEDFPLSVMVYPPGGTTPVGTYTATTDASGYFTTTVVSGTYDVKVKNAHTLSVMETSVMVPTDAVVDFGTLLEGDASDNDRVAGEDFSILATAYAACEGHAAWDPRPDFNTDGCVTGADFSLLAMNYGHSGPISTLASTVVSPGGQSGDVRISVGPPTRRVSPGQVFTVTIKVAAGGQPVDAVDSSLSFDPTYLEVVDVVTGDGLALVLQSNADQGRISYSAGRRLDGVPPDGEFILATVRFRALAPTARYGTWLGFQEDTDVFHQGESVLQSLIDGRVIVSDRDGYRLYLPLIVKGISS